MTCAEITTEKLNLPGLVVSSVALLAASGPAASAESYPAHCQITARIHPRTGIDGKAYAIGTSIRLPEANWNGKFFYQGDAGFDGIFNDTLGSLGAGATSNALSLGYAVASSDGGHTDNALGLDGSFGLDPQARLDYGYNALGTLAPLAKKVIAQFYGRAPERSYYMGCSKGGQSGMVAATRFADQFDGIIAGDPGFNLPKATIAQIYDTQQLITINPDVNKAFSEQDLALIADRILAKCDALDGATDGMVNDLSGCKMAFDFDTDVAQCATGTIGNDSCLSAAQKIALKAIFTGARSATDDLLYADWPWDPGLAGRGWRFWKTNLNPQFGPIAMGNLWATPPTPVDRTNANLYAISFDINQAYPLMSATDTRFRESSFTFMTPPDLLHLSLFKKKGKLLVYHGSADPVFSVNDTIGWYEKLRANDVRASDYARLFIVPGMNHCSGGMATDHFDALAAMVNWVEHGVVPENILASVAQSNTDKPAAWSATRSRPLCPYPKKAIFKPGAGDIENAKSFQCQ